MSIAQLSRINESELVLAALRRAAAYSPIIEVRRPREPDPDAFIAQRPEINCAQCSHLRGFNSEHQKGFCVLLRSVRATWHPAQCYSFNPKG